MKTYCVRAKRDTECVPGTEQRVKTRNGRLMLKCKCASCGIVKTRFLGGQTGGAVADFACGYNLKGKRPGTVKECFKKGQIRRYGIKTLGDVSIDDLIYDRKIDRARKARERRKPPVIKLPPVPKKVPWDPKLDKRYQKIMRRGTTSLIQLAPLPKKVPWDPELDRRYERLMERGIKQKKNGTNWIK